MSDEARLKLRSFMIAFAPFLVLCAGILLLVQNRDFYTATFAENYECTSVVPDVSWARLLLGPVGLALPIGGKPFINAFESGLMVLGCAGILTIGVVRMKWLWTCASALFWFGCGVAGIVGGT